MMKSILIKLLVLIVVINVVSIVKGSTPAKPVPSKSFSSFFIETVDGEHEFFRYYSDFDNSRAKLASKEGTDLFRCAETTWVAWEKFSQCNVVCINGNTKCDGTGTPCFCPIGDPWFGLVNATYDGTCSSFIGVPGQKWTNTDIGFSYCFKGNRPLFIETSFSRLDYFLFIPYAPHSFVFTVPPSCCPSKKRMLFDDHKPQSPANNQQRRSLKSPSGKSSKLQPKSASLKPRSNVHKRSEPNNNGIDFKAAVMALFNIN